MSTITILLLLSLTLLIPLYVLYLPPPFLITYLQNTFPSVLFHVPTSSKIIALTIDDGPSPYTQSILSLLLANECTATFFIIGSHTTSPSNTSLLSSIISSGSELANHTMHDFPSYRLSPTELISQIQTVDSIISSAYSNANRPSPDDTISSTYSKPGHPPQTPHPSETYRTPPPKYFRPGSGLFTTSMLSTVHSLGHELILGSVYPHDAQIPFWRLNAWHILRSLRPGGIIVCHDGRSWTVPMLEKVLPEMRRRGWRVVSVSELLEHGRGGVGGGSQRDRT